MLGLAILSNGMSKGTALVLQGLAIPLVYQALGNHEYAIYLLLTAALATIALLQMGAGPGLSQAIARARAMGQHHEEAGALAAAFLFVSGTSLAGAVIISAVVRLVPISKLFGANFAADRPEIIHVTNCCVLLLVATMILGLVDSALAGYQERVATNVGSSIGNLVSAGLLFWACYHRHPSIVEVVLILYGTTCLSRCVNLVVLFVRRPYLLTGWGHMNRQLTREIIHVGAAFWFVQGASVIEGNGGTYVLAHLATPQSTAVFGVIYKSVGLASTIVGVFTQPLWPAFTDAVARWDYPWIERAVRRIRSTLMLLAATLATCLATVGTFAIEHVWHVKVGVERGVVYVLALYLLTNIWTHFHYVIMMGLGRAWKMAFLLITENILTVIIGALLVPKFNAPGMAGGYLIASLLLPAWLLPGMLKKRMAQIKQDQMNRPSIAAQ